MVKIAVIKKNQINFTDMEKYALPLLYQYHDDNTRSTLKNKINDYISEVISPYIEFIEVDQDLLTNICNQLTKNFINRQPDEFFYHTEASYASPKVYLEMMYCQPIWKDSVVDQSDINNLACLFSLKHNVINYNCVIIANKYTDNDIGITISDVSIQDILRVIRRRFFFTASLIKDNDIIKYYYQNPAYLVSQIFGLDADAKIEKLSVGLLKYNLNFYSQQDKNKYINQIATRINGLYRLYGDVIVLHEFEENVYTNISIHEIKRLNVLSYGRLYDRQLKDHEIHDEMVQDVDPEGKEIEKKKTPNWSKYIIVNNRMLEWNKHKTECINCQNIMKKVIICDKCYRVKFCSVNCQQEFSSYHSDECINPRSM
ncbi:zinc finger domain-containing protein [Bandra megavirus]|uniref:Zinc finger domain-containing protein n=2 Tax=unclassified Megavirus TaxID=3068396 RepID=A0A2K9V8H0_9VIRU|nr:zinc finger domain-containing protein [Bandra megavirus]